MELLNKIYYSDVQNILIFQTRTIMIYKRDRVGVYSPTLLVFVAIKLQCRELHMISEHFKNVSEYGKCRFLGLKRPQSLIKIEIEH